MFLSEVDTTPEPRSFHVKWRPTTTPVKIINSQIGDNPFPMQFVTPEFPQSSKDLTGTGDITYTIELPTVTQDDIDKDPMMNKASSIAFTVKDDNGNVITKTLILRQVNYNIQYVESDKYHFVHQQNYRVPPANNEKIEDINRYSYLLDGSQQQLRIRSNTEWHIKDIKENVYSYSGLIPGATMIDTNAKDQNLEVGATGGYNTYGDYISFKTINDRTKWGDMTITLDDPTGSMQGERTITIIFALPEVQIAGAGVLGDNALNPAFMNVDRPKTTANAFLINENNFGTTLRVNDDNGNYVSGSRVYARGFIFNGGSGTDPSLNNTTFGSLVSTATTDITIEVDNLTAIRPTDWTNFFANKGVLIWGAHGNRIDELNKMTGRSMSSALVSRYSQKITTPAGSDDPIINGAFGDMGGLAWGMDNSYTSDYAITGSSLPNTFISYSDNNGAGYHTFFRNTNINLVYFSDGGLWGSLPSNVTNQAQGPLKIDSTTGAPMPRTSYGSTGYFNTVYNAQLFGNLITWAITVCPNTDKK
jgi:hypothetical protein